MTQETKEIITHVTVYWNEDSTTEYDDIVALDIDKDMGYPRMVIRDSDNIVEVINLGPCAILPSKTRDCSMSSTAIVYMLPRQSKG